MISLLSFFVSLLLVFAATGGAEGAPLQQKIKEQKARARQVERELGEKKRALQQVNRKERSTADELKVLERELTARESRLREMEKQARACEVSYAQAKAELEQLLQQCGQLKESIGDGLVLLAELEPQSDCAALFGREHPSHLTESAIYLERLADVEASALEARQANAERIRQSQDKTEAEHKKLLELRAGVAKEKAAMERQQAEKGVLLASLGREKQSYVRQTRQLEAASHGIRQILDELEDKLNAAREAERRRRAAEERRATQQRRATQERREIGTPAKTRAPSVPVLPPLPNTGFGALRGRLPLPVAGRVVSDFGQADGQGMLSTGVDIASSNGASICSVWKGRVAYAGMLKGYGKLIIIDHGDGFYTLYGRAASLSRTEGQQVEKGEVLGTVADGGRGLYFEIRHHRTPQNPLTWLASRGSLNISGR
ncbi:MAG: peptidoglycan DD-metalloendopeptidase family protein [Pseudomonadota bacterium]